MCAVAPSVSTESVSQIVERPLNDRARSGVVVADIESMLAFGVIHVFDFHAGGHRRSHENLVPALATSIEGKVPPASR